MVPLVVVLLEAALGELLPGHDPTVSFPMMRLVEMSVPQAACLLDILVSSFPTCLQMPVWWKCSLVAATTFVQAPARIVRPPAAAEVAAGVAIAVGDVAAAVAADVAAVDVLVLPRTTLEASAPVAGALAAGAPHALLDSSPEAQAATFALV